MAWRWATKGRHLHAVAAGAVTIPLHSQLIGAEAKTPMPQQPEGKKKIFADNLAPFHLATWKADMSGLPNERAVNKFANPLSEKYPGMNFVNPDELVMGHIIKNDSKAALRNPAVRGGCVRANAARNIYWDPKEVKVAIVTCGGLCPGLNSIIREVTNVLWYDYGVRDIKGMTGGYHGLSDPIKHTSVELTPDVVRHIHYNGGSILKNGRGGFDAGRICDNLESAGINMVFVVGGDGTQFAGNMLFEEARRRSLNVSIVGVPKSIDNDVLFIDKTFGFDSAVAEASEVIHNAFTEATSCHNGVGVVKLMGRDAGFVAVYASLASTLVDAILIPEVSFKMPDLQDHVLECLKRKGHCVVVVAEGAGQEHTASDGKVDSTGHTVYGDIGIVVRDNLNKFLKDKGGRCFYIDPSYIIRSSAIRPVDHVYCLRLASDAVHTAMRGYSGVCVGALHGIVSIFPSCLIASGKRKLNVRDSHWQNAVQRSKMPSSLAGY